MTPPIINPVIFSQCPINMAPRVKKNVIDSDIVTKNSAELTEPIASRGFFPLATRVVVTMGPQPPPPIASKNPPANPNGISLVFPSVFWVFLKTFKKIIKPMIKR